MGSLQFFCPVVCSDHPLHLTDILHVARSNDHGTPVCRFALDLFALQRAGDAVALRENAAPTGPRTQSFQGNFRSPVDLGVVKDLLPVNVEGVLLRFKGF